MEGLFRGSQSDQPGGRDKFGTGSIIGKFARKTFITGSYYKAASHWKRNENVKVKTQNRTDREYFSDLGLLITLRKLGPGGCCCWGQAGIWKLEPGHTAPGAASGESRGENGEMDGERERDRFWRINEGGTFLGSLTKAQYDTQWLFLRKKDTCSTDRGSFYGNIIYSLIKWWILKIRCQPFPGCVTNKVYFNYLENV